MSVEEKISFVQFGMELPICRTENVNTQFQSELLFINLKSVLPRINIFIQNNLYDLSSLSTIYMIWVVYQSEEWYSKTIIIVVVP